MNDAAGPVFCWAGPGRGDTPACTYLIPHGHE
jgi:hypothetical protein